MEADFSCFAGAHYIILYFSISPKEVECKESKAQGYNWYANSNVGDKT